MQIQDKVVRKFEGERKTGAGAGGAEPESVPTLPKQMEQECQDGKEIFIENRKAYNKDDETAGTMSMMLSNYRLREKFVSFEKLKDKVEKRGERHCVARVLRQNQRRDERNEGQGWQDQFPSGDNQEFLGRSHAENKVVLEEFEESGKVPQLKFLLSMAKSACDSFKSGDEKEEKTTVILAVRESMTQV